MNNLPEIRTIYNRLKASAKKRNILFDLTLMDLYEINIPLRCPILGIPLKFNRGKVEDNSVSYDRKDNDIGYTRDNMIIISYRANVLKRDASKNELKQISEYFK